MAHSDRTVATIVAHGGWRTVATIATSIVVGGDHYETHSGSGRGQSKSMRPDYATYACPQVMNCRAVIFSV